MVHTCTALEVPHDHGEIARRANESGLLQAIEVMASRTRAWRRLHRRYGSAFTVYLPRFGRIVVLSEPAEVKALFTANSDVADNVDVDLGQFLGPGSLFSLRGAEHRKQRKLLTPPFHGRRLAQLLSRRGSAVAIADIDEVGSMQTAATLAGPVLMRVLDVRDAADQLAFAAES
ncbi:cytochrome P450 [Nocardia sp. CA-135953]|uniref:cytochrome P450 n=1 Tax=Nocardia sp. CA-135953 TaxID=3239978 RepID=UPI003D9574F6